MKNQGTTGFYSEVKKLKEEVSRWKTIAYNLADEGQIKERLDKANIKAEIGLTEKEYKELFDEE